MGDIVGKYLTSEVLLIAITITLTIVILLLLGEVRKRRKGTKSSLEDNINKTENAPVKTGLFGKLAAFIERYTSGSISGIIEVGKYKINIGYILFGIILLIGTVVRVYDFGNNPPGLNQDEASGAYDSFSLANYGVDRNGDSFPVHLVAWGSGQNALYAYIIMPFIKLFGLTEVTASLGNLVFGIITLILLFFSVKIVKNMQLALITTFVLAISPWHIMLCRWGLPENILPSIVMIGVFFCALSLKKPGYFLLCSVFMSLSLYAYGTAYIVVPGILLLFGLYELYFSANKKKWFFKYATGFLVFLTVSIPVILFVYVNVLSPTSEAIKLGFITIPKLVETGTRYKQVVFLSGDYENISKTLLQYFGYYYDTVFKQQGVIWNVVNQYGNIYLISNFFFFIGFVASIIGSIVSLITKKIRPDFIFLVWFILGTILGIVNETNTNRMNIIFIPMIYLVAYGVYVIALFAGFLISLIGNSISKALERFPIYSIVKLAVIIVISVVYIGQFRSFTDYYFKNYPDAISYYFRESFKDAIEYTVEANPSNKTVYVSNFTEAYVYVLFYTKFDPREFYKTVHYANPNTEFRPVTSFANYRFVAIEGNPVPEDNCFYIVENDKVSQFTDKAPKRVERFKKYTVLEF